MIREVTADHFRAEIQNGVTVADFFSPTCGPCKMMDTMLKEIDQENPSLNIIKLDAVENRNLADAYHVLGYPTLAVFREGKELSRLVGLQSKEMIEKTILLAQ